MSPPEKVLAAFVNCWALFPLAKASATLREGPSVIRLAVETLVFVVCLKVRTDVPEPAELSVIRFVATPAGRLPAKAASKPLRSRTPVPDKTNGLVLLKATAEPTFKVPAVIVVAPV